MSAGRAVGGAMGPVNENGWQAARRTTRVNTCRGGARSGMGQVRDASKPNVTIGVSLAQSGMLP